MDTDTVTIEFTEIDKSYLGRVVFDGETLTGDNDFAKDFAAAFIEAGRTPAEFVQHYSNYAGSYLYAKVV